MKKILLSAVILSLTFVVCIAILELSARTLVPQYDPSGMFEFLITDDGMKFGVKNSTGRLWKNTGDYDVPVSINRYGFRDTKDLKSSTGDDIFVVGDSFSFGWGVKEDVRYSNLLEKMTGIHIYNISMPADIYGYEKLIGYAEKNGAAIRNLIIGICMENDLKNYRNSAVIESLPAKEKGLKYWLSKNSALYNIFTVMAHRNPVLEKISVKMGLIKMNYENIGKKHYSENIINSSADEMQKLSEHYRVTVLIIPSRGLWTGNNADVERRVHDGFVAALKDRGVRVIDMKLILEEGGNPLRYHFKSDGHWNEMGHMKAAEALKKSSLHTTRNPV